MKMIERLLFILEVVATLVVLPLIVLFWIFTGKQYDWVKRFEQRVNELEK